MALSDPRIIYGIHSITPINRTTGMPYGILKVLGDAELNLSAESVDLRGGSNKFPWATEVVSIDGSFTASLKSFPNFAMELYAGATASTTAASATGSVETALTNSVGTSVMSATTGIATATIETGEETDLKFGRYMVKALSGGTTVDVYAVTDLNASDGDDMVYQDDNLKITASALSITTTTAVSIPNVGIELTGGSGTIAMTEDDVAYFEVVPAHDGFSEISIGSTGISFPEHALEIYAQERASGDMFKIHCYKAVGNAGMVIPLAEGAFAVTDLTMKLLYDSTAGKVAKITAVTGV